MQLNLKGENVVISMKRNFPKIAKIITLKTQSFTIAKISSRKIQKVGNSQKQTLANFFGHTVYSESLEELLHLV